MGNEFIVLNIGDVAKCLEAKDINALVELVDKFQKKYKELNQGRLPTYVVLPENIDDVS